MNVSLEHVTDYRQTSMNLTEIPISQWTTTATIDEITVQVPLKIQQKIWEMRKQQTVERNFSLFGNCLQIFSSIMVFMLFAKRPELRSANNIYLLHVVCSIFGNGIAGLCRRLPIALGDDFNYLTNTTCTVIIMVARFFYTATLMFTAAMAFNRFFAICLPGKRCLIGKF